VGKKDICNKKLPMTAPYSLYKNNIEKITRDKLDEITNNAAEIV
jgi:hypothetical protein